MCSPLDRYLIAPCPDHHWNVAKNLDSERSTGEMKLTLRIAEENSNPEND